jgi:hypothetical protein
MERINDFLETGAKLGQLWMEGYFEFGDPLTNAGGLKRGGYAHFEFLLEERSAEARVAAG